MKRLLLLLVAAIIGFAPEVVAQKKVAETRSMYNTAYRRTEIILPQVKGMNCYKADFHIHTIYSDGALTPRQRVREAWYDGMDVIAITDHLEGNSFAKTMLKVLAPYNEDGKPSQWSNAKQSGRVITDHNAVFDEAAAEALNYPITLIKGTEIGLEPEKGHFNALFIKDVNAIYDADEIKRFENAHKQGGIVIHNHPTYRRKTSDKNEWHIKVYKEGHIDGVEVANAFTFYPRMVRRCVEEKLVMVGGTDSHGVTDRYYPGTPFRTHTIIFAKDRSEKSLKKAMLKQQTLVYCGGHIIGSEYWLKEFFNASIECQVVRVNDKKGNRTFQLTNHTSIPYTLHRGKGTYTLNPFESITISFGKSKEGGYTQPKLRVGNMWGMDNKNLVVNIEIDK